MGPSANWPAPAPLPKCREGWLAFRAPVRPRRQATERTGEYPKSPYWLPCRRALSPDYLGGGGLLPDAPRARLRSPFSAAFRPPDRPSPPPRQLAPPTPLDLPGGLARPLSVGPRRAPPAAPSPRAWRTKDRLCSVWLRGRSGAPGYPTARVTLPGPQP
ncbi:hypothetical protein N7447_011229 [Penicillium robsamsonii]|uniref:uncharacterized protein n=1 Tax=Penicillium robsamsonii TaxID=1792511 RepID=UPI002548D871|nr:uncharacterized protein N7447_011229 [Penicillium robsamsonii]KAJ5807317.1 hypothetical protein N7447_011229 [Penicillium robsamsonii]